MSRTCGAIVLTSSEISKVLVPQAAATAAIESLVPELGHRRALSKDHDYIDDADSQLKAPNGP